MPRDTKKPFPPPKSPRVNEARIKARPYLRLFINLGQNEVQLQRREAAPDHSDQRIDQIDTGLSSAAALDSSNLADPKPQSASNSFNEAQPLDDGTISFKEYLEQHRKLNPNEPGSSTHSSGDSNYANPGSQSQSISNSSNETDSQLSEQFTDFEFEPLEPRSQLNQDYRGSGQCSSGDSSFANPGTQSASSSSPDEPESHLQLNENLNLTEYDLDLDLAEHNKLSRNDPGSSKQATGSCDASFSDTGSPATSNEAKPLIRRFDGTFNFDEFLELQWKFSILKRNDPGSGEDSTDDSNYSNAGSQATSNEAKPLLGRYDGTFNFKEYLEQYDTLKRNDPAGPSIQSSGESSNYANPVSHSASNSSSESELQRRLNDATINFTAFLEQHRILNRNDPGLNTRSSGDSNYTNLGSQSASRSPNETERSYSNFSNNAGAGTWASVSDPRSSTSLNSSAATDGSAKSDEEKLQELFHYLSCLGIDPDHFKYIGVPSSVQLQADVDRALASASAAKTLVMRSTIIPIGIRLPVPARLGPETFVLYMDPRYNYTEQRIGTFYVETRRGEVFLGPTPFNPRVEGPNGFPILPIVVTVDEGKPNRYICTFRVKRLGVYTVSARVGSKWNDHVQRSPLSVLVSHLQVLSREAISIMEPIIPTAGSDSLYGIYPNLTSPVRDTLRNINNLQMPAQLLQQGTCKPWGIAAHPFSQDIFVTSRLNDEILRFSYQGGVFQLVFRFGIPGTETGCFNRPTGIAVDGVSNRLIIADKDNHRICIFDLSGQFISSFGRRGHYAGGEFYYPWGVAVSPNGHYIAVTDSQNFRIQLFDRDGNFIRLFSVFQTNPYEYRKHLYMPRGIVFDNSGHTIYVSDFNLRNVFAFNLDFTQKIAIFPPKQLGRPHGVAVDRNGNLLVCDATKGSLEIVSRNGIRCNKFILSREDQLVGPIDVTVCFGGFICVLDESERLRIF